MSLELLTSQKVPATVGVDDGSGTVTDLGLQFHWTVTPPEVATFTVESDVIYLVALAAGEAVVHVTSMDGALVSDTELVVTEDAANPPAQPFLVVTFGTPVPK